MSTRDLAQIEKLARCFREAIEACDKRRLPITFKDFPRASCGDVTPLLGTFLREHGLGTFDYVLGRRPDAKEPNGNRQSHAWLQQGDLIVDITADQFPEMSADVLVTLDHSWHSTFEQTTEHEADYRVYGEGSARDSLEGAYRVLCEIAGA